MANMNVQVNVLRYTPADKPTDVSFVLANGQWISLERLEQLVLAKLRTVVALMDAEDSLSITIKTTSEGEPS